MALVFGCGGEKAPEAKSAPREPAAAPMARPLLDRARRLPALGEAFVSEQHFGRPGTSVLHLPDDVRPAYVASEPLPAGSELALLWTPLGDSEAARWVLAMHKTADGFRYALERPDGTTGTAEELARCARCHAEANSDELFRVRPEEPSTAPHPPSDTPDNEHSR